MHVPALISLLTFGTLTLATPWGPPSWSPSYPPSSLPTFNRGLCQYPTANLLDGCPPGTLLVGANQEFTTIQSAVLSLGNTTFPAVILIEPGNYTEQVNVTRQGPLTLLGVTTSPNDDSANVVNIIWHNATGTATTGTYDNLYTSVLTVAPTLNSSATGSGPTGNPVPAGTPFGNSNFRAYNLNLINDYLAYSAGPSLAISISYANAGFYYCGLYSYQDTVYIGKLGNAYVYNSTIAGQTDFLYGFGTLWIQDSLLALRGCGGGVIAWKGTNTTYVNKYGAYVHESRVQAANASVAADIVGKCALGRPWNAQTRAIFANTYEDASIEPSGYIEWSTTDPRVNYNTTQAEYEVYGPGFNATGRAAAEAAGITIEMTPEQYAPYATTADVFMFDPVVGGNGSFGNIGWIDQSPIAGTLPAAPGWSGWSGSGWNWGSKQPGWPHL